MALFEAVDRSGPRCRQTEHHNAFGYLESYPVFSSSVSSSCHQLVRSSPESLFCRLPAESRPLSNSRAGRNESSAIFAVLGLEKASGDSLHSQTEGRQHMSPISMPFSSPSPVEKVFHSYRGPDLSSSPLSCFSRANRYPLDAHPFPKTSSPLAYLPFSANQFVFSVPSAMSENENVSTAAVQCHALPFCCRRHGDPRLQCLLARRVSLCFVSLIRLPLCFTALYGPILRGWSLNFLSHLLILG